MSEDQTAPAIWPLFPLEVDPPAASPFTHDLLGREAEADQLTTLIEHAPTPFVLGLDGPWGTGKTTFVRMWQQALKGSGYQAIYFNAWESDYTREPLVALIGEIAALLPPRDKAVKATQDKLKDAGALLLRKGAPIVARFLTAGLLDIKPDDLRGLDIEGALSETAEKFIEGAIEAHQRQRSEIAEFRKALESVLELATAKKPLVFFIDELDRCRPTYAVELLERIKHLLEVHGVFFVLALHRQQLAHSVRAVYGHDFDADGYLGRFFHLGYRLRDPKPGVYAKAVLQRVGFSPRDSHPFVFLADYLGFSLREQQRCVARIALAHRIIGSDTDRQIVATLLAVRSWKHDLYSQFLATTASADDLIETLQSVNPDRWHAANVTVHIESALLRFERMRRGSLAEDRSNLPWASRIEGRYVEEIGLKVNGNLDYRSQDRRERVLAFSAQAPSPYFDWHAHLQAVELVGKFALLREQPEYT